MSWDDLAAQMDLVVDNGLGDTIQLALNGLTFVDVQGFVLPFAASEGLGAFDETLGSRIRVKLAKAIVGEEEPSRAIRLRSAKLGSSTWRPAGSHPDDQGRYWIFDIQKV